jgi:hypothetical protein
MSNLRADPTTEKSERANTSNDGILVEGCIFELNSETSGGEIGESLCLI